MSLTVTPDLAAIRDACARAGYNEEGMIGTFGPIELPTRAAGDLPHFVYKTRAGRPLDTLLRMFLIGVAVDERAAGEALPLEICARAGLIARENGQVFATARVLPFRGMLVACDHVDRLTADEQCDQVMGITASTMTLADLTVRRHSRATLDVGAGGGAMAFLAAAHSDCVTATDISARSIEFARFGAALNGIGRLEYAIGDRFDPVRGRTFDLIVSNPPFAITPGFRYRYRDSGAPGDAFCRDLIRSGPAFLNDGGFFQLACDWAHYRGQDWQERLAVWFEGSGCDVWLFKVQTQDPAEYARIWIRDTEHTDPAAKARLYEEWVAFYEREGIEAISTGEVGMRRRSGANWLLFEDAPELLGSAGAAVELGFKLHDYLDATSDAALLDEPLALAPGVELEQQCEAAGGGWRVASARIRIPRGLRFTGNIDARLAGLLARSDGSATLRALIGELAARLTVDASRIAPDCVGLVRQLVSRGYLLPQALVDRGPGLPYN